MRPEVSMTRRIKFGVTLPQFGASWAEARETALLADEIGFDSVWVADHFLGVSADDPLEAWTEMSAVAALTRRVELGFLVLCNNYRPPALVAKMASTLDQISGGRLILGYGAGWFVQEYEAYGYAFPDIRTRLEQLEEGLDIIKRMWTEDAPTFAGRHYRIEAARCLPRPTRTPHPPILLGGGGERVMLRLVARYADIWNNLGAYHRDLTRKLEVLRRHCARVGRRFEDIEISQQTIGAIGRSAAEAERATEAVHRDVGFLTGAPELCLTGTPDEVIARVRKNLDLGITSFVVSFGRHAAAEALRLFAKEVIPAFR
jgi:F420-dependent oxidoreductase-like protein